MHVHVFMGHMCAHLSGSPSLTSGVFFYLSTFFFRQHLLIELRVWQHGLVKLDGFLWELLNSHLWVVVLEAGCHNNHCCRTWASELWLSLLYPKYSIHRTISPAPSCLFFIDVLLINLKHSSFFYWLCSSKACSSASTAQLTIALDSPLTCPDHCNSATRGCSRPFNLMT